MVGFKDLIAVFAPEFDSLKDLAEELTEHSFPQSKLGHRNIQRLPHYLRRHDSWVQQSNKPASRRTNARIDELKIYVETKHLLAICWCHPAAELSRSDRPLSVKKPHSLGYHRNGTAPSCMNGSRDLNLGSCPPPVQPLLRCCLASHEWQYARIPCHPCWTRQNEGSSRAADLPRSKGGPREGSLYQRSQNKSPASQV